MIEGALDLGLVEENRDDVLRLAASVGAGTSTPARSSSWPWLMHFEQPARAPDRRERGVA
jgi:hypothetical protein